jgi:type IV pilus assembly protein PilB
MKDVASNTDIPNIANPEFLKLLISKGIIVERDSRNLLDKFQGNALAILIYFIQRGVSNKDELCKLWASSIGFAYVDLDKTLIQHNIVAKLPERFAKRERIIAIYQLGEAITVATSDPGNRIVLMEAEEVARCPVSPVFSLPQDIEDAIEIEYQTSDTVNAFANKITSELCQGSSKITTEQLKKLAGDQAVTEFSHALFLLGLREKASDIHIEPGEYAARVRLRIDGVLQERLTLDLPVFQLLVSRLKILANADIAEKRKPQDGRIGLRLPNKAVDFRFSCVPTIYGEKVVLRILGGSQLRDVPDLTELYFSRQHDDMLKRLLETPNGVFFVTGPTGSGKTTTLYAAMKLLNKPTINTMTIEDPVEYRLAGINQVQVNPVAGLDFSSALRSFLRQDPDVILVGEVRDCETAKIAAQAALTGHLVFATIHTNNALQAVTRLIEIGVDPFLVAPSIIGVMAQRLVRKLCDHCKERYRLSPEEIENHFIWDGKTEVFFYREKGCGYCNFTGFAGRIAIHELFMVNNEIRTLVANNTSIIDIQARAKKSGFRTMRYDGVKKVLRGLTTIEEVNRVTLVEEEP